MNWISVSESLPSEDEIVLILPVNTNDPGYTGNAIVQFQEIARFSDGKFICSLHNFFKIEEVKAWLRLPPCSV